MRKPFLLLAAGLLLAGTVAADPAPSADASAPAAAATKPAAPAAETASAAEAPAKPDTMLYPRTPEPATPIRASSSLGGTTVTLVVALLGAAAGWVLWRRLRGLRDTGRGGQQLAIAETRSLGNRQFLVVAAYGERKFLLGVCPGRIDLLSPLDAAKPPTL